MPKYDFRRVTKLGSVVYIYTAIVYITKVFINAYRIYAPLAGGQKLKKTITDLIVYHFLDGYPIYQMLGSL